jgi:hypothetical protein
MLRYFSHKVVELVDRLQAKSPRSVGLTLLIVLKFRLDGFLAIKDSDFACPLGCLFSP